MPVELHTVAEMNAREAERLPAFGGLNLLHMKRQVALLLQEIGRQGIFDEYTKHDITHIDVMLSMLCDWIIPADTQSAMSKADWLMVVLAIYFHDVGMLVTRREYERRERSNFPAFKRTVLFTDTAESKDYKASVDRLKEPDRERFLYQEFVRYHHAQRIRHWVAGAAAEHLGVASEVTGGIDDLLHPLDKTFRQDLGVICESHHENDLDNLVKYSVSKPYGPTSNETVNLQYAAVLLRTADLLHITKDRTPSILFKALNPSDPISQREWAKQMAVRAVRSQVARGANGNADPGLPRNTVEVHASFSDENGFFGLTSFLNYAESQLKLSHEWVTLAQRQRAVPHAFPWTHIDQTYIETDGFLREQFEFTIDQAKILDLLTGHTLYNDSGVVLRELVQNAIDAVRLQFFDETGNKSRERGSVLISWDPEARCLSVTDNGTGMSQEVIEKHLLKVGASRYQDPRFRERNPGFSPISRFGIGVLSTFMIADEVEIITSAPDDTAARRLLLRSVHGKYLIRLLDKWDSAIPPEIRDHGTRFTLTVRPSARLDDVEALARRWVVAPDCVVSIQVGAAPIRRVGFDSVREALEASLQDIGLDTSEGDEQRTIRIVEQQHQGVDLAFAVRWSNYFREWAFLTVNRPARDEDRDQLAIGTCIEGVRVSFSSPGFRQPTLFALANAKGPSAPRTNVARSGFEVTNEYEASMRAVYAMYVRHIEQEIVELHSKRRFSLTWALQEGLYLLSPLLSREFRPINKKSLAREVSTMQTLIVERDGERLGMSLTDLENCAPFWTVDCELFRSAERLLREVPGNASLSSLLRLLSAESLEPADRVLLCNEPRALFQLQEFYGSYEPSHIIVDLRRRRIDFQWKRRGDKFYWIHPPVEWAYSSTRIYELTSQFKHRALRVYGLRAPLFWLAREGAKVEGVEDEMAIVSDDRFFFLPGTPLASWFQMAAAEQRRHHVALGLAYGAMECLMNHRANVPGAIRFFDMHLLPWITEHWGRGEDVETVRALWCTSSWRYFTTAAWQREPLSD